MSNYQNKSADDKPVMQKARSKSAEEKVRAKEAEKQNRIKDKFKLVLALLILAAGVFGYYQFTDLPVYVRMIMPVLGVIVAVVIVFFWCAFGRNLITFVREATHEMQKVVWPDRPTTMKMTLMVLFFVAMLALFIWLADTLISWLLFDLFLKRG